MSTSHPVIENPGHPPARPARLAQPTELLRGARSAWLANTRQELRAPVTALLDVAGQLAEDARERGQEDFLADLEKVHASARALQAQVNELLDPDQPEREGVDWSKRIRHDLRTPLNHILGYCDLWLEDAPEKLLEGFQADLEKIRAWGRQTLARLDDLVEFVRTASAADPASAAGRGPAPGTSPEDSIYVNVADLVARAREVRPAEKGSFLVVDDNPVNRDLFCRWLRRDGHEVAEAANGLQALEMVRARPFDGVLLDIIMPELNGYRTLERLKADPRLRHLPVIMISAFDDVDSVVRCIEMGAEDYLPKPPNPVLLRARVGACLEKKRLRDREVLYLEEIERERRRSDELLHGILPAEVVRELKATNGFQPRRYEGVAVMFCDIAGFTPYCDRNRPEDVVAHLQRLTEAWERIALSHQVEKIKTIGDAFMAAAGLLQRPAEHPVLHCVRCGLEMIRAARALNAGWDLRVGIHFGPVVAGVVGTRQYLFDLWGDTVNTAARMESHGVRGAVVLSGSAWAPIAHRCRGESSGVIEIKGKGPLEMIRFEKFVG
jgi:class 3 adenylate cyclase